MVIIATNVFDAFLRTKRADGNRAFRYRGQSNGRAFQRAELPVEIMGDLRAITEEVHTPLAVRSSSLLEDALFRPFAGVYGTKMIPNNQPDVDVRFRRLIEAIKLVYASTYFSRAKSYTGRPD